MAIEFEGQLRMETRDSCGRSLADFLGIRNGSKFLAKFAQNLIPPAENPKEWWTDYNIFCLLREEERRDPAVFYFFM
ncbi:MAG: hypothetical protein Q8N98_02250, partial [bacterium]|nr:hypothetical protein [bacterium]